jgi:hypothetical protein
VKKFTLIEAGLEQIWMVFGPFKMGEREEDEIWENAQRQKNSRREIDVRLEQQ